MPLSAGMRLGPYEILSSLGKGGMGEVYRARDQRLGREVALKVLPSELSAEPQRLKYFEQEARSASALNHPNIITIYEIGQADGTQYTAMELVEGKTLRKLLLRVRVGASVGLRNSFNVPANCNRQLEWTKISRSDCRSTSEGRRART
jgi:serine/threonine protein kinase